MYLLLFNVLLTLLNLLEEIFLYNCKMGNKRKMTLMHLKEPYLYLSYGIQITCSSHFYNSDGDDSL